MKDTGYKRFCKIFFTVVGTVVLLYLSCGLGLLIALNLFGRI